ncbi:MAG: phosphate ABC transporter permease PstA [Nitrospinae bacterium]|nr:phosphate ABC transporter permease PstA [Nitrospinota bacterium]
MVSALMAVVFYNGLRFFWPKDIVQFALKDGKTVLGQNWEREKIPGLDPASKSEERRYRVKIKQANRDIYGADFVWMDEDRIASEERPGDAVVFERYEWGDFYGFIKEVKGREGRVAEGPDAGWIALQEALAENSAVLEDIRRLEKDDVGAVNYYMEQNRLQLKKLRLKGVESGPQVDALRGEAEKLRAEYDGKAASMQKLKDSLWGSVLVSTAGGEQKEIPVPQIARAYKPNGFGWFGKTGFFLAKVREFVFDDPRESNTEGGVFPAIFGTVMMVLLMSLFATPLGVLAAFYLREYAKQGAFVSLVRIAVNNLAGVPSIVFGVFGLGFFIYFIGGGIDRVFYSELLPTPTFGTGGIFWASLTLAFLTVPVVIVATEEGLAAVPRGMREASLALGATQFETMWRVVMPAVMPSVLTGLILAMARAVGEVAPLMITGVVKLAPSLPLDGFWPFVHLERKFMHLGFHIYDVGFQSPNVDAARPMVFTTTLLLILIVLMLNFAAILLRTRLRKKLSFSGL